MVDVVEAPALGFDRLDEWTKVEADGTGLPR